MRTFFAHQHKKIRKKFLNGPFCARFSLIKSLRKILVFFALLACNRRAQVAGIQKVRYLMYSCLVTVQT